MRSDVESAHRRAVEHLDRIQKSSGAWAGEVVWNSMLVCQYVIVCHILNRPIEPARRQRILRALAHDVGADGGWGMHSGGPSWLFHTALGYVALRLLGTPPEDPLAARARQWIANHGGVLEIPTWGRIWLAVLGLYPWRSIQPIVPELWLLPSASPMHPSRLYCHMRMIYLGLSYLYGHRFAAPTDETVARLREELYPGGVPEADFDQARDRLADTDVFESPAPGLRAALGALRVFDQVTPDALRRRALATAFEHILFEFRSTNYVCLSPVNGLLFCLALHIADPDHPDLPRALAGLEYWVWEDDERGLRICGARSDIWDTSFVIQALCEGPALTEGTELVSKAARWLKAAQNLQEIVGGAAHYRAPAYGGWGFADEHHPWPVSDCTAEAIEALALADQAKLTETDERMQTGPLLAAVEFILARQNEDGGFGSYEARRGSMVLRRFNPAEMYGNCMLEYSYTECTGSCVSALVHARRFLGDAVPPPLRSRIESSVDAGVRFLFEQQDAGGAWAGFWGINFTYGTFFATRALLAAGISRHHSALTRACRWLVERQRSDGGWGESWRGMLDQREHPLDPDEPSLVVQTSWAVLTLLAAAPHEREAIERGIDFVVARQSADGTWPEEPASGCFFNTAVLDYVLYRHEFPLWALSRYQRTYAG